MNRYELNARPLSNKDVGNKFVLHPEFSDLIRSKNSLIVGPRGSGKTTMLKMLTPEAQHFWQPEAETEIELKKSLDFIGIYIPMSRIFQDDLESRYFNSTLSKSEKSNLLHKIYFLNIVESIVGQVYFFIEQKNLSPQEVIIICEKFNQALDLKINYCYKINSLITGISSQKLNARRQIINNEYKEENRYQGEIISNIEPILNLVNEMFDFEPQQKYALCFDELDVYASDFTADMIKSFRGISTNILLKLTLAPIHNVTIKKFIDPPSQVHDFDRIYLWPSPEITGKTRFQEENRYLLFTEKLATQSFKELIDKEINIDILLGKYSYRKVLELSQLSENKDSIFSAYDFKDYDDDQIESLIYEMYSQCDINFKKYIQDQIGSDSISFDKLTRKEKSETIRKLKPIVFNRLIVTQQLNKLRKYRRQKVLYQYHGKKIVLKCLDGNPRYLKKLVEYLSEYIDKNKDEHQTISISNQARALVNVKNLFLQRINSIPLDGGSYKLATGKLVKDIGNYLSSQMNLRENWNSSFPSYIKIPNIKEVKAYEDAFKKAINNGALLIINDYDLEKLNTVKHKSLRLNYLLHIEFKLPIRKYYPTSFENLIKVVPSNKTLFNNDRNPK